MLRFCNRTGKMIICGVISIFIYFSVLRIYQASNNKVIAENQENKAKSLHFFIDR